MLYGHRDFTILQLNGITACSHLIVIYKDHSYNDRHQTQCAYGSTVVGTEVSTLY